MPELALRGRIYLLLAGALLYVSATALYHSLSTDPIRDEHQFVAGAHLIAERGLHPYRDFPYFHMPNLSYLLSPIFRLGDHPFLAARLFSAAASAAIVVVLLLASNALSARKHDEMWMVGSLSVAILFTNTKLFADAAGFVWNHAPSALASLLAFAAHRQAIRRDLSVPLAGLSGFLLGSAIGFRLTAFPLILPFLAALLLVGGVDLRRKALATTVFALAGLLANAPALSAMATAPDGFWFGNLGYPRLNTLYRRELGYAIGMTPGGKLELAVGEVFSRLPELLLLSAAVISLAGARPRRWLRIAAAQPDFRLLLTLIPFAFAGALAPTPAFAQYFIGPMVLVTLLAPYGMAYLHSEKGRRWGAWLLAGAALLSTVSGGFPKSLASLELFIQPGRWAPMRLHVQGAQIAQHMPERQADQRILTLAPTYVIEGGLSIFPEFASGPFAWRVGHLMSPADRQRFMVVSPADLGDFMMTAMPTAMLTGPPQVGHLEAPLAQAAQQQGFRREVLSDVLVLWLR